ncbi:MAG: hypothetical protein P4L82_15055 [Ancalomicrobiaceae bacterium]|nr:hypothetical protein [Ancalomicrobiaceae bacterium]
MFVDGRLASWFAAPAASRCRRRLALVQFAKRRRSVERLSRRLARAQDPAVFARAHLEPFGQAIFEYFAESRFDLFVDGPAGPPTLVATLLVRPCQG